MIYVGYIIFCFGLVRLLVALTNAISNLSLPQSGKIDDVPLVSVLIPARNEEKNIENLLNDINTLTYTNYEVIVYDDESTDNTYSIVQKYADGNRKITVLHGKTLEQGWLGKSFACYQLALAAKGEYFLFLDADVRVGGSLIERSILYSRKYKLGLLSMFPKQILDNRGAWLAVPLMNWILLSLLPLVLVRSSKWISFSAANGQFMFFDAAAYKKMQPHVACKKVKAEDIAICQYFKRNNLKVSVLLGDESIQCHMYDSLDDAINGFSKNVFAFFGNSVFATLMFTIFTTFAPVFLFFVFGFWVFFAYMLSILFIRVLVSIASRQSVWKNLLLMLPQHFIFIRIVISAIVKQKNKSLAWKGRVIS